MSRDDYGFSENYESIGGKIVAFPWVRISHYYTAANTACLGDWLEGIGVKGLKSRMAGVIAGRHTKRTGGRTMPPAGFVLDYTRITIYFCLSGFLAGVASQLLALVELLDQPPPLGLVDAVLAPQSIPRLMGCFLGRPTASAAWPSAPR